MTDHYLQTHLGELEIIWDALVRQDDMPHRADAIVVGGCDDIGLAERAAELYRAGVSDLIVVTGYRPKGMDMSEAEFLGGKCIEFGAPESAVVLEKEASNTGENIRFAAELVKNMRPDAKHVVLIHRPFMGLRFLATAEAQWPHPQPAFYATCQAISFEDYCRKKGIDVTAWEMLGDFKRMDEYVEKGYQTRQFIPDAARAAYGKLVQDGFVTR